MKLSNLYRTNADDAAGPAPTVPFGLLRRAHATTTIGLRSKPPGRRLVGETIDLERVVWDPDYRARVRDRLNRGGTQVRQLDRKAG